MIITSINSRIVCYVDGCVNVLGKKHHFSYENQSFRIWICGKPIDRQLYVSDILERVRKDLNSHRIDDASWDRLITKLEYANKLVELTGNR